MMTRSVYDHAHFHRQQCCQSVSFELGHISHFILYIKKESTCIYLPVKIKHYLIEFAVSCMNLHVFAKVIHQTLNNEGRIYSVMHLFASYLLRKIDCNDFCLTIVIVLREVIHSKIVMIFFTLQYIFVFMIKCTN